MPILLTTPAVPALGEVVAALRAWQHDGAPVQLHPGDVGWFWRFGVQVTAAALRTWSRDRRLLAIGLLDGPGVLRLATAPGAEHDEELATQLAADVANPDRGVLPAGDAAVEARFGGRFVDRLRDAGWQPDEPWTPLRRDLSRPVAEAGLRVDVAGPAQAEVWIDLLRSSFEGSTATVQRWHAMAEGAPFGDARCLLGHDGDGVPVAVAAVWSAGAGRPGLIEPLGVPAAHRGRGYGRGMTLAAAAALRDLGCSSALVCTPSANVGAVATYASAGFEVLPESRDLRRPA